MAGLDFWSKPLDLGEILAQLREDERNAVSHALADVRQEYLAYLETWREGLSESDLIGSAVLDGQIHTLRRQLGMQAEPTATGFANWSASGPDGIASAGKQ